jgi:hypothetical protein
MRVVAIFRVFAKMAQTFRHLLYMERKQQLDRSLAATNAT